MRRGIFIGFISFLILFAFFNSQIFGRPSTKDLRANEKTDPKVIEKTITMALDQLKKGDFEKTIDHLAEAMMLVKNMLDLHLAKLVMCTEVRDFGDYDARDSFEIKAGEALLLYMEPDGYTIRKEGDAYKIWVSQDASISNDKGEVIFQRNNWVNYKRIFPTPILPFYLTNNVSDIPAGKYTYSLTLKDHYKNTFFSKTFEFIVK
ncbi:hypothetical protein ACFLT2_08000 [Acidobacteriota bacterium]